MPSPVTPNLYEIRGDFAYLEVGTKSLPDALAVIDTADLGWVLDGRGRWYAFKSHLNISVRRSVTIGINAQAHQLLNKLIAGTELKPVVMHMDCDGLNLRRSNLKAATRQELAVYARHSKSKRRGAFRTESGRWRAIIGVNNRVICLGTFATEAEAGRAYDIAAREYFGDLARINFPSPL